MGIYDISGCEEIYHCEPDSENPSHYHHVSGKHNASTNSL